MIAKTPRVAPHFVVRDVPGQGLFFLSEDRSEVFVGQIFRALLPMLDGTRAVDEILDGLSDDHGLAEALYSLELLEKHGCIVEAGDRSEPGATAYWSALGGTPTPRNFEVRNHSRVQIESLQTLLAAQGLHDLRGAPFRVVVVDDYLDPVIDTYSRGAAEDSRAWALARPTGTVLWFGPVFYPGQTACWDCLRDRLYLNRRVLRFVATKLGEPVSLPNAATPAGQQLFESLLVVELGRALARPREKVSDASLLTFDTLSGATERHTVVRRPQCAACGDPAHVPQALDLRVPASAAQHADGGLRSEPSARTFEALKHHVSPVVGVVSHVRSLRTGDDRIHVYVAGQNPALAAGSLAGLKRTLRNESSGKGVTDVQAKTSALCEAIERYASVFQGYEAYTVGSLSELGPDAIHPNSCMLFSDTQYAEREVRNRSANHFSWIPRLLHPDDRLWWSPVFSLADQRLRYLPTAHVYFHSERLTDPVGSAVCSVDSNGNAAGRTLAEAVLQGLLELIERDSVALWWYPRAQLPGVDLASFRSDYVEASLDHHRQLGRALWVLDATSDLGVPSFVAVSRRTVRPEQILLGFGANVDARIALSRALGELHQMLPGVSNHGECDSKQDAATARWLEQATLESEPYLIADPGRPPTTPDRYVPPELDIALALERCLDACHAAGLEVFAADLTRPDIDLKVVKVIAPGLRHFWSRFAPGRLYDVPAAMGRTPHSLDESELNPTAMFL